MSSEDSPYVFRASAAPLVETSATLRVKEARMLGGITARYQERIPGPPNTGPWCETGHTAFIVAGRLRYEFPDHDLEIGPGDVVHIPAGHAHRHRPHVVGGDTVKYFITEFS